MNLKKLSIIPFIAISSYASGFKIPEQSANSVALAAANIATSFSADAAYYNPANIVFLDPRHHSTFSLSHLRMSKLHFRNHSDKFSSDYNYDTSSKKGDFIIPTFHFVAPFIDDNFRFSLSVVAPAGTSMKWEDTYPRALSKLFELEVLEISPSIAYLVNEDLAVAVGVRGVYSKGKAKNEVDDAQLQTPMGNIAPGLKAHRELEGDSIDFGYNLALTYKPTSDLSLAATYRSKVNMTLKGNADIQYSIGGKMQDQYNGDVSINVPLPAILTLAASYEYSDFTFMFAYDRTYWSSLKEFDFEYSRPVANLFDKPVEKDWIDTNTYRIAVAYDYSKDLRLMAGFAIDEASTHNDKIKFELPDTKSYVYSVGASYKINENFDISGGFLYQDRQKREVKSGDTTSFNNVVGEFDRAAIMITNLSLNYRF